jgi:hypothetical protein
MGETMFKTTALLIVALALTAVLSVAPTVAGDDAKDSSGKEYRLLGDRFNINAGSYLADLDTQAGVGVGNSLGTVINFEDLLNIEQYQTTFRLGGFWRFSKSGKHAISLGYVGISREGTNVLEEEIEFDGKTYRVGGVLDSEFKTQTLGLGYRYSFVNTGRTEAGFTAGLSTYAFEIALDGELAVEQPGFAKQTERAAAAEEILAPLPTVGMFINYGVTPRFIVKLHAAFLNIDIADYKGQVVDSGFALEYYFIRNLGVGLGAARTDIEASYTGDSPWKVGYRQGGVTIYLSGVF